MAKQNKRVSKSTVNSTGKLRIIAGLWRSRILPVIDAEGLRPTSDRVRETLFNWLQADIAGSVCLDLFAGAGGLGFEAVSRGASRVVMVEKNTVACQVLRDNQNLLQADNIEIRHTDAIDFLATITPADQFDIVFLDPPYQSDLLQHAIDKLCLNENCMVYLELNKNDDVLVPQHWQLLKDKTAGQIHYCLYQVTESHHVTE